MNEPKTAGEAEKPTEDEELTSEQLDDVSGGFIIINSANALTRKATVAPSLIDDPDGGGPLPP